MERSHLEELARAWIRLWQNPDLNQFLRLHSQGFVDRSAAGRNTDREAFFNSIVELYNAFPDFRADIAFLVTDQSEGKVAIRWTARGTHQGTFMGIPPTGRRVRFEGIDVLQYDDEEITGRWGEWNGIEILEQLKSEPGR